MVSAISPVGTSAAMWYVVLYKARVRADRVNAVSRVAGTENTPASTAVIPERSDRESAPPFGPSELPYVPQGYGPEELAARTRAQFPELGSPLSAVTGGERQEQKAEGEPASGFSVEKSKSPAEVMDEAKCETCEKRKYQDGSDDPGVSFKTAQHVDPSVAQSAVRGHEQEHVVREQAEAEREGRKVVEQSVTYHTGICPECGRFYIAGGTTRTVTKADNSENPVEAVQEDEEGESE